MAAVSSSPLTPGYFLDRYELLCPLADGGMASVWVARLRGKHGFEKLLAIKTVLPQYAADERFQQMFLDEARIASRIEHANVAQILDVGEQHGITYLVMEWVDGDSLSRLYRALKKKNVAMPLHVLLRIVADACAGLHEAHELDIVHRDVSPQNVLVSQRGIAKVIDFGIAKARDRTALDTNAGLIKGKIHYMAPEQARGDAVDRRADVFALGALLYHYATGAPPYDGDNQLAVLNRLTAGEPPAPLPPSVPMPVAALVLRALAHDPAKRFATAIELKEAIEVAMVACKLSCTQSQVAAFVAEHGAGRTASRKEAIDLAISAAAERARVRDVLRPNPEKSATGVLASDARFQRTSSFPPPPITPSVPPPVPVGAPSGSIDVVVVEPAPRRGRLAIVAALLLVAAVGAGAAITLVVVARRDAPSLTTRTAVARPTGAPQTVATASASAAATIDIAAVDPDSLPTAEASASAAPALTARTHTTATAPTETATAPSGTTRRSRYGF